MKCVVSVNNMRISDKKTIEEKTPSLELMKKAAEGIFASVMWHGKILIACGTGNNAGDGYALATLLNDSGHFVEILLLEERFSNDGKYYYDICKSKNIPTRVYNSEKIQGYDIIVDCLLGTGFKGDVTGKTKDMICAINQSGAYVVSADINSGLDGDSGIGDICVNSDLTVSIGTYKSGHFLNQAKDKIKDLVNCDIGIDIVEKPYLLLEKEDVKKFLGRRSNYSHKGTYGYIALIGGSLEYSGAIKLASLSSCAMRSGCGVVKIATPKSICQAIMPYILEGTLYPLSDNNGSISFVENEIQGAVNGVKAVGIGMGLGQKGDNEKILEYILKSCDIPVIIDADGLNTLARMDEGILKNTKCRVVLTPHLKEMERLCGVDVDEIKRAPIDYAVKYARKTGTTLLLKGTTTIITDGDNVVLSNTGCAGMATAGSGDVLSGIVTALCASYSDTFEAVCVGAYINGYAGEIAKREYGDISMVASDTARSIAKAIMEITE